MSRLLLLRLLLLHRRPRMLLLLLLPGHRAVLAGSRVRSPAHRSALLARLALRTVVLPAELARPRLRGRCRGRLLPPGRLLLLQRRLLLLLVRCVPLLLLLLLRWLPLRWWLPAQASLLPLPLLPLPSGLARTGSSLVWPGLPWHASTFSSFATLRALVEQSLSPLGLDLLNLFSSKA